MANGYETPTSPHASGYETQTQAQTQHPTLHGWEGPRLTIYDSGQLHVQLPGRQFQGSEHRGYGCVIDRPLHALGESDEIEELYNDGDCPRVRSLATQKMTYAPCIAVLSADGQRVTGIRFVDSDGDPNSDVYAL